MHAPTGGLIEGAVFRVVVSGWATRASPVERDCGSDSVHGPEGGSVGHPQSTSTPVSSSVPPMLSRRLAIIMSRRTAASVASRRTLAVAGHLRMSTQAGATNGSATPSDLEVPPFRSSVLVDSDLTVTPPCTIRPRSYSSLMAHYSVTS